MSAQGDIRGDGGDGRREVGLIGRLEPIHMEGSGGCKTKP